MNAIKPATPLPWRIFSGRANAAPTALVESEARGANRQVAVRFGSLHNDSMKADAAYIVHACNAYPELVEAVQSLLAEPTSLFTRDVARALLAKLEAA